MSSDKARYVIGVDMASGEDSTKVVLVQIDPSGQLYLPDMDRLPHYQSLVHSNSEPEALPIVVNPTLQLPLFHLGEEE